MKVQVAPLTLSGLCLLHNMMQSNTYALTKERPAFGQPGLIYLIPFFFLRSK